MLKAVRLDPNEHQEILAYITGYVDRKGKKNESEAIRTLLELGLQALKQSPLSSLATPNLGQGALNQQTLINVLTELNKNISLSIKENHDYTNKQDNNASSVVIHDVDNLGVESHKTLNEQAQEPIPKDVSIKTATMVKGTNVNPLLANILNNAKR